MGSVEYLEKVIEPMIKKFCDEKLYNDFACALGYYNSHILDVDDEGNFGIAPEMDDGELSDAISDDTGYCVSSIEYSIIVEGM